MIKVIRPLLSAGLLGVLAVSAPAVLSLPAVFSPGLVLQRDRPVCVWGWAGPGARVTAAFAGQTAHGTAGPDGRWTLILPATPASAEGRSLVITAGPDRRQIDDVLVGDVWLCGGQSNMTLPLAACDNADSEIAAANRPDIRLLQIPEATAGTPQADCAARWTRCTPETARAFSGVAYFFGRELGRALHVPIGLIHSSWGGSPIEAWMPRDALAADPEFAPILARWDAECAAGGAAQQAFAARRDELWQEWETAAAQVRLRGFMEPGRPAVRTALPRAMPGGPFNAMIAPLAPFPLRGVLWYQGEANAQRAEQYRRLFPAAIGLWRELWRDELPFVFVQLPNLRRQPEPSASGWAELREAQAAALALPATAMVVTIDIGNPLNLHPANKQYVARRAALAALGLLHGAPPAESFSPRYAAHEIRGPAVFIRFQPDHGPLRVRGQEDPRGFVICGADRRWRDARAELREDGVRVWHEDITQPVAVRYAWADDPAANLVNAAGLPLAPFRTDDWPETTAGRR